MLQMHRTLDDIDTHAGKNVLERQYLCRTGYLVIERAKQRESVELIKTVYYLSRRKLLIGTAVVELPKGVIETATAT